MRKSLAKAVSLGGPGYAPMQPVAASINTDGVIQVLLLMPEPEIVSIVRAMVYFGEDQMPWLPMELEPWKYDQLKKFGLDMWAYSRGREHLDEAIRKHAEIKKNRKLRNEYLEFSRK